MDVHLIVNVTPTNKFTHNVLIFSNFVINYGDPMCKYNNMAKKCKFSSKTKLTYCGQPVTWNLHAQQWKNEMNNFGEVNQYLDYCELKYYTIILSWMKWKNLD